MLKQFKQVESVELSHMSNGGPWKTREVEEFSPHPTFVLDKVRHMNLLYCDHAYEIIQYIGFPNLLDLNMEYIECLPYSLIKVLSTNSPNIESLKVISLDHEKAEIISKAFQNLKHFEARSRFCILWSFAECF